MSFEEQIKAHKELSIQIAELEQRRKELGQEILKQMPEKILSLPDYIVRRQERISIATPLEEARKWGATKTEEVVDKAKLKQLYQRGEEIPGISSFAFVQISQIKQELNTLLETETVSLD